MLALLSKRHADLAARPRRVKFAEIRDARTSGRRPSGQGSKIFEVTALKFRGGRRLDARQDAAVSRCRPSLQRRSHPSFIFNSTPPTYIYTLPLHDSLPVSKFPRP